MVHDHGSFFAPLPIITSGRLDIVAAVTAYSRLETQAACPFLNAAMRNYFTITGLALTAHLLPAAAVPVDDGPASLLISRQATGNFIRYSGWYV